MGAGPSRAWLLGAAAAALLGCDFGVGDSGGGCAKISQDDYELPVKRLIPGAVAARVTQSGLDFITARVRELVLAFFDADANGRAVVPLAALGLGDISTSLGPFDARVRDLVVTLDLAGLEVRLVPGSSPARIEVTVTDADVGLVDGTVAGGIDGFLFSGDAACALSNGAGGRVALLSMTLVLELATDAAGNLAVRVLPSSFDLQEIGLTLTTDCDRAECLDGLSPGDDRECLECETICPVIDLGAELATLLQDSFDDLFDGLLDLLADDLANLVLDDLLNGRPLAVEGELPLAELLGASLGWMRTARPLGVLARPAGEAFRVTGAGATLGLDVVLDAGLDASPVHPCAGDIGVDRTWTAGPRPTFDGFAQDGAGVLVPYDVGLGVSMAIINEALWALWKSGTLCIDATTEDLVTLSGGRLLVSAGTLDLLLPGVAGIAGPDAPVRVAVRPRLSERVQAGDVVTLAPDGRLAVHIAEATIDVEALVGDAWMRMLGLRTGLVLSLALVPEPEGKLGVSVSGVALEGLTLPDNDLFEGLRLDVITPFVVDLVLQFLADRPLSFDLGLSGLGAALGVPLEPVIVGVGAAGAGGDWLAIYVDLTDPSGASPRALLPTLYDPGAARAASAPLTPVDPPSASPEADPGCAGAGPGGLVGLVVLVGAWLARRRRWA